MVGAFESGHSSQGPATGKLPFDSQECYSCVIGSFEAGAVAAYRMASGGSRPEAAGRGNDPNSIVRTYSEPVEWPVLGEQIDGYTVSTRPSAAVPSEDAYRSFAPHESCSAATAASTDGLTLAVFHATAVVTTLKFSVKGHTTTVFGAIFFIASGMRATP